MLDSVRAHLVADVPNTQVNGDAAVYALQAVTHQTGGRFGDNGAGATVVGGETDETSNTTNGCGW